MAKSAGNQSRNVCHSGPLGTAVAAKAAIADGDRHDETEIAIHSHQSEHCAVCRNQKAFNLHTSLLDEFRKKNVVIFAGAGISTEDKGVVGYTFFEEICSLTKLEKNATSFPDAMKSFCCQPNGLLNLVSKIKERFDYVDSFPDIRRQATRFHNELATIFLVDTIITTNWDTYFEQRCGAQSFVTPQDFAFWDASKRRVLKIHGSITNFGTLIATRQDYEKNTNELNSGVLGSFLKTLLLTRTIVFAGYSARDEDFNQVWNFIRGELGQFGRQHYIVTIEEDEKSLQHFRDLGLVPICTDATFFVHAVKEKLQEDESFISDEMYDAVGELLETTLDTHRRMHKRYNVFDDPEIILCASYQDGMVHACERILNLKRTGMYSERDYTHGLVHGYAKWREQKYEAKKFADVAYIDGYLNTMIFVTSFGNTDIPPPPSYFLFAKPPIFLNSLEDFTRELKRLRKQKAHHAGAYKEALSATEGMDKRTAGKVIISHKCQLF